MGRHFFLFVDFYSNIEYFISPNCNMDACRKSFFHDLPGFPFCLRDIVRIPGILFAGQRILFCIIMRKQYEVNQNHVIFMNYVIFITFFSRIV